MWGLVLRIFGTRVLPVDTSSFVDCAPRKGNYHKVNSLTVLSAFCLVRGLYRHGNAGIVADIRVSLLSQCSCFGSGFGIANRTGCTAKRSQHPTYACDDSDLLVHRRSSEAVYGMTPPNIWVAVKIMAPFWVL